MSDEIKIINTEQAEQVDPDLPNAGWQRDEELAKRKDALEQASEELGEKQEIHSFDPSKIAPDNEILQYIDELHVDKKQPGYAYIWVYEGLNGREVVKKQRLGWVVVTGDDPECLSLKDVRGYRKIGDTILMRIPQDKFEKLEQAQEYRRLVQQQGIEGALREMGAKYRDKGFIIHDDARSVNVGRKGKSLMDIMQSKAKAQGAHQTAMKGVDTMIRQGTVPGIPTPGKRGG
jgi:hypothetical protein